MGFVKKIWLFGVFYCQQEEKKILSYTHRKGNAVLLISFVPLEENFCNYIDTLNYCLRAKNNAQPKENTLC